jgi:hypothetical protein
MKLKESYKIFPDWIVEYFGFSYELKIYCQ